MNYQTTLSGLDWSMMPSGATVPPSGIAVMTSYENQLGKIVAGNGGGEKVIDLSSSNYTGSIDDTLYDYIVLSGSINSARTVSLYHDNTTQLGSKRYFLCASKQLKSTGESYNITVNSTTGGSAIYIVTTTSGFSSDTLIPVYVDNLGNVISYQQTISTSGVFVLPVATNTVLGGVTIGSGINVSSGHISVPLATSSNYGEVEVGSNINVNNGIISIPQSVDPSASPTFVDMTLSSMNADVGNVFADRKICGVPDAEKYKWSMSYSATTRIFTLTLSASTYYYVSGHRYNLSAGSIAFPAHSNTTGLYYFYFDSSGTASASNVYWDLFNTAQVSIIYYNSNNMGVSASGLLHYELHGDVMDPADHYYHHTYQGTQYQSGGALGNYTVGLDTIAGVSYSIDSALFSDEDINLTSTAVPSGGPYYIGYWDASGNFNWTKNSTLPYFHGTTNIQYNVIGSGLIEVTGNNQYFNYYLIFTNGYSDKVLMIPGQNLYSTLAAAQASSVSSLILPSLPSKEFLVVKKITYRRANSNSATTYYADIEGVQTVFASTSTVTGYAGVHNSLSGRDALGAHPLTAMTGSAYGNIPYVGSDLNVVAVSGNKAATTKYLSQTGDGTNSGIPTWNTLPLATASSLGQIIAGSGLSVDLNGFLSAPYSVSGLTIGSGLVSLSGVLNLAQNLLLNSVKVPTTISGILTMAPVGMGICELGQNSNGYYFKIKLGTGTGILVCFSFQEGGAQTAPITVTYPSIYSANPFVFLTDYYNFSDKCGVVAEVDTTYFYGFPTGDGLYLNGFFWFSIGLYSE